MKISSLLLMIFLLCTGLVSGQSVDSTAISGKQIEIPAWLIKKIKEMSLDEKHYAGTKVFAYEIDTFCVYQIDNPFSSLYYDLYRWDGSRLDSIKIKMFIEKKGEPLLIWENYPAVPFDSLKKNIKNPEDKEMGKGL